MTSSYKSRRRMALLILLVGMPIYVVVAVTLLNLLPRMPGWVEVPVYILIGVAWILPFKRVFLGIGQVDPDENQQD